MAWTAFDPIPNSRYIVSTNPALQPNTSSFSANE
jgi:hypothetical protein